MEPFPLAGEDKVMARSRAPRANRLRFGKSPRDSRPEDPSTDVEIPRSARAATESNRPVNEQLQLSFDESADANSVGNLADSGFVIGKSSRGPQGEALPHVGSRFRWNDRAAAADGVAADGAETSTGQGRIFFNRPLFGRVRQWIAARSVGAHSPAARVQLYQRARAFVNHTAELKREAYRPCPRTAVSVGANEENASALLISVGLIGAVLALAFVVV